MSYYTPNDHDREVYTADRYRQRGEGGAGWLVLAGVALVIIVGLVAFGGGGDGSTSDVHPGGAGAPPVILPEAAPDGGASGTVPDPRAQ